MEARIRAGWDVQWPEGPWDMLPCAIANIYLLPGEVVPDNLTSERLPSCVENGVHVFEILRAESKERRLDAIGVCS